ncbi:MAG: MFS transporter [Trueperaceae bacterium]|nr:MFS transporter [Trueperaceae bacterium]
MDLARAAQRITTGLFIAHSLGSAGVIATATVASIVGAELSGRTAWAGLPAAAFQIGTALAALLVGALTARWGRRPGLTASGALGTLGMAGAAASAVYGAFGVMLACLFVAGTANAAVRFARFTAAEVNPAARRGRAVAIVVMGGIVGSVLGPALVAPSGALTQAAGLGELAGPFVAAALLFLLAMMAFTVFLRPEPREVAEALEASVPAGAGAPASARPLRVLLRDPGVRTAMVSLVLAQGVMVMVMGITSLYMRDQGHALAAIGWVFSAHTLGMFAFSVASGWATDRFGRTPVLLAGGAVLALACLLAPLSAAFLPLLVALFLLGLGWNLCYVAGSALLTDRLYTGEKSRTQGVNDLFMGSVSAASSLGGGVVYAVFGFSTMAYAGLVASLVLLAVVAAPRARRRLRPT